MTRINTHVPIIDEHLRAARTEYCRIPNSVIKLLDKDETGLALKKALDSAPANYTVRLNDNPKGGEGHMKFFFDKLMFVERQYKIVNMCCNARGFKHDSWWPNSVRFTVPKLYNDWNPSDDDILLCKARQIERIPEKPHIYGQLVTHDEARKAIELDLIPERVLQAMYNRIPIVI